MEINILLVVSEGWWGLCGTGLLIFALQFTSVRNNLAFKEHDSLLREGYGSSSSVPCYFPQSRSRKEFGFLRNKKRLNFQIFGLYTHLRPELSY